MHYRRELGRKLYGPEGYGVGRDEEASKRKRERNYEFFGAPVGAVLWMDGGLESCDVLGVGMYLQSLCLLLAERGVGSCVS